MKSMKKKTFDSKVKREAAYLLDACLKAHASKEKAKDTNLYLVKPQTPFKAVAREAIAQTSTALLLLGIKHSPYRYTGDAIVLYAE